MSLVHKESVCVYAEKKIEGKRRKEIGVDALRKPVNVEKRMTSLEIFGTGSIFAVGELKTKREEKAKNTRKQPFGNKTMMKLGGEWEN